MNYLLILGEAPGGPGPHDPEAHALYDIPKGGTGSRLKEKLGLSSEAYLSIVRRNLFPHYVGREGKHGKWDATEAKQRAWRMRPYLRNKNVLFCGMRVARAFQLNDGLLTWRWAEQGYFNYATVPHPAGTNRWWNVKENREPANQFLRWVGAHVLLETTDFTGAWEREFRQRALQSLNE